MTWCQAAIQSEQRVSGRRPGRLKIDLFLRRRFHHNDERATRSSAPHQDGLFDPLKPADEFTALLRRQMLDRFLDGFERHALNLAWDGPSGLQDGIDSYPNPMGDERASFR